MNVIHNSNDGHTKSDKPISPPSSSERILSKLTIPAKSVSLDIVRPASSSSASSLFLSSSPASAAAAGGYILSPPTTPLSSSLKSTSSRNDIFSEEWTTPTPAPLKAEFKGLGLSGRFEQDYGIWDSEARRRRSGAYTWSQRTGSRSPTPGIREDGIKVDYTSFLGRGLTSVVYSAELETGETVAAKIPFNNETRQVLEREGAILAQVHSIPRSTEYVIPYYGKRAFDDTFALCLELCPQNMQDYVNSLTGASPPVISMELWKNWLSTLLTGVEFLHDAGFLHNDIKPHNILLTSSLHPYLSDFAVASPMYDLNLPSTPDLHILGTTVYTAPELLSAETVPTTPASDIYSLGITMFVAAAGVEPFCWTRSNTQKIMLKKRGDIFAGMDIRMPSGIKEIIEGMCDANPKTRWDYSRIRTALEAL